MTCSPGGLSVPWRGRRACPWASPQWGRPALSSGPAPTHRPATATHQPDSDNLASAPAPAPAPFCSTEGTPPPPLPPPPSREAGRYEVPSAQIVHRNWWQVGYSGRLSYSWEFLFSHCDGIFSHTKIQVLPYKHLIEYISSKQQYFFIYLYLYIYFFIFIYFLIKVVIITL